MKGTSYSENLNIKMSGSKRRSRLGLGVSHFESSYQKIVGGDNLGTIEMVGNPAGLPVEPMDGVRIEKASCDAVCTPQCKKNNVEIGKTASSDKFQPLLSDVLGAGKLSDANCWKLLRRSKQLLSMRTVTPALAAKLELRRDWNLYRKVETLLDCFPSLKHSYSSLRGKKFDGSVSILSNGETARVGDIARSHSIRLDPVDAPKELFKYRQRIQKIITWAYSNGLVPVMLTLTVFHRWNNLAPLIKVLRDSWSDLFRGPAGMKRKERIGLRGYIRRMEETFNDADSDFDESLNSGWHPHYHVILLVPREKLSVVSDYETELRSVWVELVRKHYLKTFGEDIPSSYLPAFREHGLVFSRYVSDEHAARCGCPDGKAGVLFEVKDGKYLAKIMGTDAPLYGGDSELTYLSKRSKTPFDLLKCEVTANLADLWCEYAIATKKIPCFTYSKGLQGEVDSYFDSMSGRSVSGSVDLPTEGLVVRLKSEDYQWLYRHFQIGELLDVAAKGYDVAKAWLKDSFGIEVVEDEVAPPVLNDSLEVQEKVNDDAAPVVEESAMFVGDLVKTVDDCTFDSVGYERVGFSSLNRYALFKPVEEAFDAEVAVTFPSTLTLWSCSPPAMRPRDLNCQTISAKVGSKPYYYLNNCKNKYQPPFFNRNKAPP